MKIVIDSNVFISGIFWKGASNEIIRLAEEEKVEISPHQKLSMNYSERLKEINSANLTKKPRLAQSIFLEKYLNW